jgi:hypothetical protein
MNLNFFFLNLSQPAAALISGDAVFNSSLEPNKSTDFFAKRTPRTLTRGSGENKILKNLDTSFEPLPRPEGFGDQIPGLMTTIKGEAQLMRCESL